MIIIENTRTIGLDQMLNKKSKNSDIAADIAVFMDISASHEWWRKMDLFNYRVINQFLPISLYDKRSIVTTYADLRDIYHKDTIGDPDDWAILIAWIENLPNSELITA